LLSDISSDSASFGTPPWTQQVSTCNSVVAPVVNSTVRPALGSSWLKLWLEHWMKILPKAFREKPCYDRTTTTACRQCQLPISSYNVVLNENMFNSSGSKPQAYFLSPPHVSSDRVIMEVVTSRIHSRQIVH
jgi:hypothetical protein